MSQSILLLLLLSVSTILPKSMAQELGVDLCACSPGSYTFELDFSGASRDCDNSNIAAGPGIEAAFCDIRPFVGDDVEFDEVTFIRIVEHEPQDTGFTVAVTELEGPFSDGDTFTYNSITTTDPNLDTSTIPGGIALFIRGINKSGQRIENIWLVKFTNDCNSLPVFGNDGNSPRIGVTKLTTLTAAPAQYCPLAAPTPSPTLTPTTSPTATPTTIPTQAPTRAPTVSPTNTPTLTPTLAPTLAPTMLPTKEPTPSPTLTPTTSPTATPTTIPTQAPTRAPTVSPTNTPTLTPTLAPTLAPTMLPTKEPTVAPTRRPAPTRTKPPSRLCRLRIRNCQP